ncbi:hypothetical protein Tamer19_16480 [Cupriavidus sp. TA19]|uniref:hypothetical protein n=1 Tax=unclassified Cupriavidus TaxID=2640874 RepID=UPI00272940B2|nr:hypothetical protein [Cupriavidus sp. TA19]GLC92240.1 hypothetical protein Tamer19_16480 [Cupriavidus sp. TA19]
MTDDPFVRCCETCANFRRRPDGLPLCMEPQRSHADAQAQRTALRGTNALCRCPLFQPQHVADKPDGEKQ